MAVYYNEIEPFAAAWLRKLIAAGIIADGDVDERSITEVHPDDIKGFKQCHFFAGIGGWSYALRLAGWSDERHVWTGSCPCQPFSVAGKRLAYSDPRNLWPEFARLIADCGPATVFGEQVASKAGRLWLAGVHADLEALDYSFGAADLCAAGVGAPQIRQRLWWVADAGLPERRSQHQPCSRVSGEHTVQCSWEEDSGGYTGRCSDGRLADADNQRQFANDGAVRAQGRDDTKRRGSRGCGLGDASEPGLEGHAWDVDRRYESGRVDAVAGGPAAATGGGSGLEHTDGEGRSPRRLHERPGRQDGTTTQQQGLGVWSDFIWIPCADGKARRIEPGIEPLVDGIPDRVGRLRGYGNAIVPQVAAEFIAAYRES